MTHSSPPRMRTDKTPRAAAWDLADFSHTFYGFIEHTVGLLTVAFFGIIAVLIAIGLTGPVISAVRNIPAMMANAWRLAGKIWSLPWENWIVFPFVLAVVVSAMWYWIQSEQRNGDRPTRGRTILSGDELRRSASRQNLLKSRPPKSRRPF